MPKVQFGICLYCHRPLATASEADYLLCSACVRFLDDDCEPDPEREAEIAAELAEEKAWEARMKRERAALDRAKARKIARHNATYAPRRPDVTIARAAPPILRKSV